MRLSEASGSGERASISSAVAFGFFLIFSTIEGGRSRSDSMRGPSAPSFNATPVKTSESSLYIFASFFSTSVASLPPSASMTNSTGYAFKLERAAPATSASRS